MTYDERFPTGRHPLCTCPPLTFTTGPTAADREECRRRTVVDTHPMIDIRDLLPSPTTPYRSETP